MDAFIPGASAPLQAAKPAVFQFGSTEVRTVDRDGQVWFVAGDVAKALNYADAVQMTRVLDEDEKGLHTMQTLGGNQQVVVLSESGLYHALLKSRKPEARPFRRWVTQEVLPAIRRNGTSSVADAQIPDAFQKTRYLLTVYADGRSQITPLPQDAAVLSAKNKTSMSTLMREFIPSEILPDLMHIGLDRLARMAERGRNVPVCATPADKEVEP
ncbi:MAG: Bro-N domain-containing protein [Planctomycetia bacterium]|nr:Bro-N domain-containing protein [Planctomycetia bacterium]